MAVTRPKNANGVTQLQEKEYVKGESLWLDAWRRLLRNRAAMLGLVVILINIFVAVFAGFVAPQHYATQVLEDNNAAPKWVMTIFPSMTPRSSEYRIGRGWTALVTTGDQVDSGVILMEKSNGDTRAANTDGTIFIDDNMLVLVPFAVDRFEIPSGWDVLVNQGESVIENMLLLSEIGGSGEIRALRDGRVYLTEELVLVRPMTEGYVTVSDKYPLGADNLGRDLLSRIIYGARVSLMVAFVGPLVSFIIGVPYGLIAGYFGGRVDNTMMRFVDTMYAFPTLLLIILFMAFFRSSFGGSQGESGSLTATLSSLDRTTGGMFFIFVGVGITSWMGLARLTRGQVLSLRETEFVLAASSVGARTPQILMRHVLPNVLGPIIIAETLTIPNYISYEAFLSFIGLGVNAPTPSWGLMIAEGAGQLRSYPHQALFPALALFLIMFAFNFLGDGLRDALDPRMRGVD
jgi:oligopeptide transport system permease protein